MAEKINFTFLGTGSSIPTARRNHPAMLLQYKTNTILIDCGEGTQSQFRRAKLNFMKVNKIFITHWHADHILGLPGLLQTMNLNGYSGDLIIYGPKGSKKKFQELIAPFLRFNQYTTKNKFNILVKEISEGKVFDDDEFLVGAASMDHDTPTLAYSFIFKEKTRLDKDKLKKLKLPNSPLLGDLVKGKTVKIDGKKIDGKKLLYTEPQRKITIIMDTRISDKTYKFAKDADLLITESSFISSDEEIARDHAHLTAAQCATIAKKAKAKALMLTHPSQRYDMIPKLLIEDAKPIFKNVKVAEDFDTLQL